MSDRLVVNASFVVAPPDLARTGLLGWASFTVGPLMVGSVGVRRRRDGTLVLAFPRRVDRHGVVHFDVRPRNRAAGDALLEAVRDALRIESAP